VAETRLDAAPAAEPSALILDVEDCHPARAVHVRIANEPTARILDVLERSAFDCESGGPAVPYMPR
jgi:hypothetical protein